MSDLLSLSVDDFLNLQVIARFIYGEVSVGLEPSENYKTSTQNSPSSPTSSGCSSNYIVHFQVSHDNIGPMLRIHLSEVSEDYVVPSKPLLDIDKHDDQIRASDFFGTPSVDDRRNGNDAPSPGSQIQPITHDRLPVNRGSLFPWTRSAVPPISQSFVSQNPSNDGFAQLSHGDGIHDWTSQQHPSDLGSEPDLNSPSVFGITYPIQSPSHQLPMAQISPSLLFSNASTSHQIERNYLEVSSRAGSSPSSFTSQGDLDSDPMVTIGPDIPHPVSSEGGEERSFACNVPGCSHRFKSQHTLRAHMESHKNKRQPSFTCTMGCSERFTRQHDRLRHEVAKHGRVCEWSCEHCRRFFSSQRTLAQHKCPKAVGETRWVN